MWLTSGCYQGRGRERSDFRHILKLYPIGFDDRLDVGEERMEGIKDDSKMFGLNKRKDSDEEGCGWSSLGKLLKSSVLGMLG